MRNKVIGCIIILLLASVLFLSLYSNKKVKAYNYGNLQFDGRIVTEENILIAIQSLYSNDGYDFIIGRYITGEFNISYYDCGTTSDIVDWLVYCDDIIYDFGYSENNILESINYALDFKIIELSIDNEVLRYGYQSGNSQGYYDTYGNLVYYSIYLPSSITSFSRCYNSSQTIINNNTVTTSENVDYNYYFSNLKTNFANNQYGSCGFIAIASLLTYYDFFFNNDFIDDSATYSNNYCANITFIENVEKDVLSTSDFTFSPGYHNSFQYFLIDEIAIDNLNINFNEVNGNPVYSTTDTIIKNAIENYIEVSTNISSTDYSVNILSTETAIKNEIDCGRPVIISFSSFEYESSNSTSAYLNIMSMLGHAAIAYGYIELSNGETIYRCHLGWHGNALSGYTYDSLVRNLGPSISCISFVYTGSTNNCNDNVYLYNHSNNANASCFGLCHKHSGYEYYLDKTIINSSTDEYSCPVCHNHVMYASHIHEESYSWHNLNNHLTTCPCGLFTYQAHVIDGPMQQNGYYICSECGGFARMGITPFDEQETE